jgi:glutamate formiminotransferase
MLECVANVSEGRDAEVLAALVRAGGEDLLDVHVDAHHHRAVLTLVGETAPRRVAEVAVAGIDLRRHVGAHPRLGALDVVPFVALRGSVPADALAARDRFATWLGAALAVPVFLYGPERTLPEVRRGAFTALAADHGPTAPHERAGACAVGARPVLVAFNVWLEHPDLRRAHAVAAAVRGPGIRALGLAVGDRVQVSMNLIDPTAVGPAEAHDRVAAEVDVAGTELVGLVPEAVLQAVGRTRWAELDLDPDRTIEARLVARAHALARAHDAGGQPT